MQKNRFMTTGLFAISLALMLPISAWAASINLYDAPKDDAKVTGTIDLAGGVIPIYTPANSLWVKVGDPHNGNTGWVKSSELKDSKGNIITFSQRVTESDGRTSQATQVKIAAPAPAPTQVQQPTQQSIIMQQKASQESALQAQQVMGQALDTLKNAYQQSIELMQNAGFPKVPSTAPAPQKPVAPDQALPANK